MESLGAIVFLPREEQSSSPFLSDILYDPAALWLAETLRSAGVERFFAVCEGSDLEKTRACFPEGSVILSDGDTDATARLHAFLEENPGGVVVITRPVLLAPEGTTFSLPGKEPAKCVYDLKGSTLLSALRDGKSFGEAVNALGDAASWRGRYIPLKSDLSYRAFTVDPLAKGLSIERLVAQGVRVVDPANTYVGPAVTVGEGSTILPGTTLYGRTVIGRDCVLGPNTLIRDCEIGDGVMVNSSQLNESVVEEGTTVGPFAYVRPHTHVGKGVKVGDFVELKNSTIGDGTKISHLTYVGDSDVGGKVNFGCGTVTVNYDGAKKFRTTIGDGAFIGCNTNLVAPVVIGEGAYTAAGSTITEDVPPDSLAIARERQVVKKNWVKRRRGN
ncbi:MAG: UDP-N-acetylglucosamine diphosphorylase [Oscillospiraceae bacterium]|nr:UDP-N-acetylglucosamine diphosphorylase [Oscillospiraceae bacterium]